MASIAFKRPKVFNVSRPVRMRVYLAELLRTTTSCISDLKVRGLLRSYSADDVRKFLTENPVFLQRAFAKLRGVSPPRDLLPIPPQRKTRSRKHRGKV